MSEVINALLRPKVFLYIFREYRELHQWEQNNLEKIRDSGGIYNRTTTTATFPNGAKLILGHAVENEDLYKFYGLEYTKILGNYNAHLKSREKL